MATSILYFENGAAQSVVVFDSVSVQAHSFKADVTEHPVEDSVDEADGVRRKGGDLRIDGVLSDFPLPISGSRTDPNGELTTEPGEGRARVEFEKLLRLHENGKRLTVITSLRQYGDMVIAGIDVPRDVSNSRGQVRLSILFKPITVAVTVSVPIQRAADRTSHKKVTGGKQTPTPTVISTVEEDESWLSKAGLTPKGVGLEKTPPAPLKEIPASVKRPSP